MTLGFVAAQGDALQTDELPPQRQRPDEPHFELLLGNDPKVLVAHTIQQEIDRRVEGQQQMRDHGQVFNPLGPRVSVGAQFQRL